MSGYDLHTHSRHSDGETTIAHNVARAIELGLEGLGVTDHDTTDGFEEATAAAEGSDLEVVLGTEFSAEHDGTSVHVLGFWFDPAYEPLVTELARLRDERTDRARRMVERLVELGVPVTFEQVRAIAGDAPLGRPHVAQAVVDAGAASDLREVFDRFLADGGPAYVAKHAVDPVRAVQLLVAAGGVAVLAHPGLYGRRDGEEGIPEALVEQMAEAGLAGIEADHPDHHAEHVTRYRALARALDLAVTAGSDHHGHDELDRLGAATTSREVVEELRRWRSA